MNKPEIAKCKKLIYKSAPHEEPTVLFGIVLYDDGESLSFKTARRAYYLKKSCILSVEDTELPFRGGN